MEKDEADRKSGDRSVALFMLVGVQYLLAVVGITMFGSILWDAFSGEYSTSEGTESGSPPALWSIRASLSGRETTVIDLTRSHTLYVSMDNHACSEEARRRCCRAEVRFDFEQDHEVARRLCSSLEQSAYTYVRSLPHGTGITPTLLDRFVDHDRFELLYSDRFGTRPPDRNVLVTYVDDH